MFSRFRVRRRFELIAQRSFVTDRDGQIDGGDDKDQLEILLPRLCRPFQLNNSIFEIHKHTLYDDDCGDKQRAAAAVVATAAKAPLPDLFMHTQKWWWSSVSEFGQKTRRPVIYV